MTPINVFGDVLLVANDPIFNLEYTETLGV